MRKIKIIIYAILGVALTWSAVRQGNYGMAAGIAFFVLCAIGLTWASIGQLVITWDDSGITLTKRPKPARFVPWSDLKKLKVDHLGYHIQSRQTQFRISRENMPKELLVKIREAVRANT